MPTTLKLLAGAAAALALLPATATAQVNLDPGPGPVRDLPTLGLGKPRPPRPTPAPPPVTPVVVSVGDSAVSGEAGRLGRVAARLLELADRFGIDDDGAVRIELRLSQEELAGWTGASLESVGRALSTMRSLNWIETGRREIRILDIEALRNAAA